MVPLWIATIVALKSRNRFYRSDPVKGAASGKPWGGSLEDTRSGRGDRRRCGRRLDALPPCKEGLDGRGSVRAHRAHRRVDLARRGPAAAVQHELQRRSAAQVFGRSVQGPARGNRPGRQLPRDGQSPAGHQRRAYGRVPQVLRYRQHHRRAFRDRHPPPKSRSSGRSAIPTAWSARSIIPTTAISPRRTLPRQWRPGRATWGRRSAAIPRSVRWNASPAANGWSGRSGATSFASTWVCATGNYSWHTSQMLGIYIPAIPVEHQYIVTDEVPELVERHRQGLPEMAVLRESDASYYLREERQGYILGPYEKGAPARFWDGVPDSFERDLFPGDLDRLMPHLEAANRPGAELRAGGHQGHRQRPDRLYAGRQPLGGAGMGSAQCVAERGSTASASRRRAAPAGSSRNGSSRASRPST